MYKLGISNKALKVLEKLEDSIYLRISGRINSLENVPRPNGVSKLTDFEGYRIKIGDYRVLYTINDKTKEVVIYKILHRKEVYRRK